MGAGHSLQGLQNTVQTAYAPFFGGPHDYGQGPCPSSRSGRGSLNPAAEGRYHKGEFERSEDRFLFEVFSGDKEGRWVSSRPRPQAFEHVCESFAIQDADHEGHPAGYRSGGVVRHSRSKGCIFPRPHLARPQAFSEVCVSGAGVSVQGSSFRTVTVSKGLHEGSGCCPTPSSTVRSEGPTLSRRLADCSSVSQPGCGTHSAGVVAYSGSGVPSEFEEEQSRTQATNGFSRPVYRFRGHAGLSVPGEGSSDPCSPASFPSGQACPDGAGTTPIRDDRVGHGCHSTWSAQGSASAEVAEFVSPRSPEGQACGTGGDEVLSPGIAALEGQLNAGTGGPADGPPLQEDRGNDGCLPNWLGSCVGGQVGEGPVVTSLDSRAHKCVGTEGCLPCPQGFPPFYQRQACFGEDRQHFGCLSRKSPGGHEVTSVSTGVPGAIVMGGTPPGFTQGDLCARGCEHGSGPVVQDCTPFWGMEAAPTGGCAAVGPLRVGPSRPFCDSRECPLRAVVLPGRPRGAFGPGCSVRRVAGRLIVCFSPAALDSSGATSGEAGVLQNSVDCTPVARETLVSGSASTGSRISVAPADQGRPLVPGGGSDLAPQAGNHAARGVASPEPRFRDLDEGVRDTMENARALSTRVNYGYKWKWFSDWCTTNQVDPVSCSVLVVLRFLQSLLNAGRAASTLRGYVAAISLRHEKVDGLPVGRHEDVVGFMNGVRRLRPGRELRAPSWDLPFVLQSLTRAPYEPMDQSDLQYLSRKTALLLALASAKRVGELQALSVSPDCLRWKADGSGVDLRPNPAFLPKVITMQTVNQGLEIAALESAGGSEDISTLCPVRALRAYIDRTQALRGEVTQLFVCYGGARLGRPLSKQRLSHWIVDAISAAYEDRGLPTPGRLVAHSTRGMVTSWAALKGVPMAEVCAAASWSVPCTFARFYRLNVASPLSMGTTVLYAAGQRGGVGTESPVPRDPVGRSHPL